MTRISQTQLKLREAKFFLDNLDGRQDSDGFRFYLSAFLSASRSVTFVLQAEQKDVYDDWFPEWVKTLDMDEKRLLTFMNNRRVAEVHKKGTELQPMIELVPVSTEQRRRLEHSPYGFHWVDPSDSPSSDSPYIKLDGKFYQYSHAETVYYFEVDGTSAEVVNACSLYVEILQKLVEDFEQRLCLEDKEVVKLRGPD